MFKVTGSDGKEYGPVTAEQLRQWQAEGRVTAQTQVLPEGATSWTMIGQLPELAVAAPGPAPITPVRKPSRPAAADQVNGPAVALIIVAVLDLTSQLVLLVFKGAGLPLISRDQMAAMGWPMTLAATLSIIFGVIGIVGSVIILAGAVQMKKLENYGLALAASIIAMIPCLSRCCWLGLPIGIWALVVLMRPEVKSAFH